jgi:uncharacterized repeat protein (TIGR01451 family)
MHTSSGLSGFLQSTTKALQTIFTIVFFAQSLLLPLSFVGAFAEETTPTQDTQVLTTLRNASYDLTAVDGGNDPYNTERTLSYPGLTLGSHFSTQDETTMQTSTFNSFGFELRDNFDVLSGSNLSGNLLPSRIVDFGGSTAFLGAIKSQSYLPDGSFNQDRYPSVGSVAGSLDETYNYMTVGVQSPNSGNVYAHFYNTTTGESEYRTAALTETVWTNPLSGFTINTNIEFNRFAFYHDDPAGIGFTNLDFEYKVLQGTDNQDNPDDDKGETDNSNTNDNNSSEDSDSDNNSDDNSSNSDQTNNEDVVTDDSDETTSDDNSDQEQEEDADQSTDNDIDTAGPQGLLKFLDYQDDTTDNKTIITQAGCYYVSKISHEGAGGQLKAVIDGADEHISDEYNSIPNYTPLGYYEANEEMILKILPKFNKSPEEVLSTNLDRVKVVQFGDDTFRFYFEDWNDNDFNDLVLEVRRGNCDTPQDYKVYLPPAGNSIAETTEDSVGVVYFATGDEVNPGQNDILAIRFLDSNGNVETLSENPDNGGLVPCNGNCKFAEGVDQDELGQGWYQYTGAPYWRTLELPTPGTYTRSVEIIDIYGNVTAVTNTITKVEGFDDEGVQIPEEYQDLYERVQEEGSLKVIATFADVEFGDTASIENKANQVQADLNLNKIKTFRFAPGASFTITNDNALEAFTHESIQFIEEDSQYKTQLASSNAVINNDLVYNNLPNNYRGRNTYVAVIDTGSETSHPFLANLEPAYEACFTESYTNPTTSVIEQVSTCPSGADSEFGPGSSEACLLGSTGCEHGTHVAGIAAGINNGSMFGVASEAGLISINAFGEGVATGEVVALGSDIVLSLEHVWDLRVNQNVNVVAANMSLSAASTNYGSFCNTSSIYTTIVGNLKNSGVASVAASGNDSEPNAIGDPACTDDAVAVGSTDDADVVSSFSNNALPLDLYAPGEGIVSSLPGGGTGSRQGTSMAAPHVAGAFAVLQEAFFDVNGTYASVDVIENALKVTGVPATRDGITRPRIDVCAATTQLGATIGTSCFTNPINISGTVFKDDNNDGVLDPTESGMINTTVELIDANTGAVINSTISNLNGDYQFTGVINGNYQIRFVPAGGNPPSTFSGNVGADDNNDIQFANGLTPQFLVNGVDINYIDGGFRALGVISGTVWFDEVVFDSQYDSLNEIVRPGITVELIDANTGTVVDTTVTANAAGINYEFADVQPGTYQLRFSNDPASNEFLVPQSATPFVDTFSSPDENTGLTPPFPITLDSTQDVDAGYEQPGTVAGSLYDDANFNGFQNFGETRLANWEIRLYEIVNNNPVLVDTIITNNNQFGVHYLFNNLRVGNEYQLEIVMKNGWAISPKQTLGLPSPFVDSDFNPGTGLTDRFILGDPNYDIFGNGVSILHAGVNLTVSAYTIDGTVFEDTDNDGDQDAGEPTVANATVELIDQGAGTIVDSVVSDAAGNYEFINVVDGTYQIRFTHPDGNPPSTFAGNVGADNNNDIQDPSGLTPQFIVNGADIDYIDGGFRELWGFGGYAFEDINLDGSLFSGANRVNGVILRLYEHNAGVDTFTGRVEVTANNGPGANGQYFFDNLDPDKSYVVEMVLPNTRDVQTLKDATFEFWDSDFDRLTNRTDPLNITNTSNNTYTVSGGFYRASEVEGRVWDDLDGDGTQDPGEPGINGVEVRINPNTDALGNTLAPVITANVAGQDGVYRFEGVQPESPYNLEFVLPTGYSFTIQGSPIDATDNSDVDVTTGITNSFSAIYGSDVGYVDAGLTSTSFTITGLVWEDTNNTGAFAAAEPRIANATVELVDVNGNVVDTALSSATGIYVFNNVPGGSYQINFIHPSGNPPAQQSFTFPNLNTVGNNDIDSYDVATSTASTPVFPVTGNINYVWGGFLRDRVIQGTAWEDTNNNGERDAGEQNIPNVTVELLDMSNNVVPIAGNPTTTNATGEYTFNNAPLGTYRLRFTHPTGRQPSDQSATLASVFFFDNNDIADPATGITDNFPVVNNDITYVDGGFTGLFDITGSAFTDLDNDGLIDATEPTIPNVTVDLFEAGTNNFVASTTTNTTGEYTFTDIAVGDYYLQFTHPQGAPVAPQHPFFNNITTTFNTDIIDPTGVTDPFTISDQDIDYVDGGFITIGRVAGTVWEDMNPIDSQRFFEQSKAGVVVELINVNTGAVLSTTTNGNFSENYEFNDVAPGDYVLRFANNAANNEFLVPQSTAPLTTNFSSPDETSGLTPQFTINAGDNFNTVDAGYVGLETIQGWVWEDANNDGLYIAPENRLDGWTINLYELDSSGSQNLIDSQLTDNTLIFTVGGINYIFDDLRVDRQYQIEVVMQPGWVLTQKNIGGFNGTWDSDINTFTGFSDVLTLPTNFIDMGVYPTTSIGNQVWSDYNGNGIQDAGEPGLDGVTVELLDLAGNPVNDAGGNIVVPQVTSTVGGVPGFYRFEGLVGGTYLIRYTLPNGSYIFSPTNQGVNDDIDSDPTPINATQAEVQVTVNPSDNFTNVDAGFIPQTDLEVTKIVSDPTPDEGDTISYSITVQNNSLVTATNIELTDVLPVGVTFGSIANPPQNYDPTTGIWDIGTMAPGANETLIIAATVDTGTGGQTITNTASITNLDQTDIDTTNDTDDAVINVVNTTPQANLSLTGTSTNPTPAAGDTFDYQITLTNNGPDTITNIDLENILSAGQTFVSSSDPSYNPVTGIWNIPSIPAGTSITLTITVSVDGTVTYGTPLSLGSTVVVITPAQYTETNPGDESVVIMNNIACPNGTTWDNAGSCIALKVCPAGSQLQANGDCAVSSCILPGSYPVYGNDGSLQHCRKNYPNGYIRNRFPGRCITWQTFLAVWTFQNVNFEGYLVSGRATCGFITYLPQTPTPTSPSGITLPPAVCNPATPAQDPNYADARYCKV